MKLHKGDFIVRKRAHQGESVRYQEEHVHGYVGCTDDGRVGYGLTRVGTVWNIFELSTGMKVDTAVKKDDAVRKCEELKDKVIIALKNIKPEYRRLNR